jgi:hypothetical protein
MLTPTLEKLILSGNATYNTFSVGGTSKHILNVPSNRFIIITGITYQHSFNSDSNGWLLDDLLKKLAKNMLTQLKVFSSKSTNNFVFRNNINISVTGPGEGIALPMGSTKIDCYLIHESDVAFSFCPGGEIKPVISGLTSYNSVGYRPPYDYGKEGMDGAIVVALTIDTNSDIVDEFLNTVGGTDDLNLTTGSNVLELTFPVLNEEIFKEPWAYPIASVEYVEVYGNPTNISATL